MNVFRPANTITYNVPFNAVDNELAPTTAISWTSGTVSRVDLSTVTVTDTVTLTAGDSPFRGVFDGTDWWLLISNAGSYYLSKIHFAGGSGSVLARTALPFTIVSQGGLFCVGSTIYLFISSSGAVGYFATYDLSGTLVGPDPGPTFYRPMPELNAVNLVVKSSDNYVWAKSSTPNTMCRIDLSGSITNISLATDSTTVPCVLGADTTILVFGTPSKGTITGTTFTSFATPTGHWQGTPASGGNPVRVFPLDADNWLSGATRFNKSWGAQDVTGGSLGSTFGGGVVPYGGGWFIFGDDTRSWHFSFTTDNNPITITSAWQATSPVTMEGDTGNLGDPRSTIHNYQFSAQAGWVLKFTLDSAVYAGAQWSGFNGSSAPYISVHDSTEYRLQNSVTKTMASFTVPTTDTYTVRVQENPANLVSAGTIKLGYTLLNGIIPDFSITESPTLIAGHTLHFNDLSTDVGGVINAWTWTFGDTNVSTLKNPTHVYAAPGNYTVTLTASDGSQIASISRVITVISDAPVAGFTRTPDPLYVGQTISFTDTSTNTPTSWAWNFGDSHTSSLKNPTHSYVAAGTYTVLLTATNATGSGYITHNVIIVDPPTIANGSIPNCCMGVIYPVQIFTVTGGIPPYVWTDSGSSLPTGMAFNTANQELTGDPTTSGSYNLNLTVTDSGGFSQTINYPFTIYTLPTVSTVTLPNGNDGHPYSQSLTGVNGSGTINSWAITAGALPAGLTLDASTGLIHGTITSGAGTFNFTVRATDTNGCS